jgi:hypothetical protein
MILDDIYESLAILYISLPNAVASYDYKLILVALSLKLLNVGLAGDHLLIVAQFFVFLVLEIAEGTGEVQTTIDPTHVDHSPCIFDALLLFLTFGFMVKGKIDGSALPAQDTP